MSSQPLPVAVPKPATRSPEARAGSGRLRDTLQGLAFAGPALIVLGLFLVYPAVQTIRLAFYRGFGFRFEHYLRFRNFKDLLTTDPNFLDHSWAPSTIH